MKSISRDILGALGFDKVELSILLTDNDTIRFLKNKYFGIDEPTDVLAFPMEDDLTASGKRFKILGDIVISVPTALEMANLYGVTLDFVIALLLTHGILHLLGYDHETKEEALEMDKKTMDVLKHLGYDINNVEWYKLGR